MSSGDSNDYGSEIEDEIDDRDEEWSQSEIQQRNNNKNQQALSPAVPLTTKKSAHNNHNPFKKRFMQAVPSDYMSFSTIYNREFTGTKDTKLKQGQKKLNSFELIGFMMGKNMQAIFEVRAKKKDI